MEYVKCDGTQMDALEKMEQLTTKSSEYFASKKDNEHMAYGYCSVEACPYENDGCCTSENMEGCKPISRIAYEKYQLDWMISHGKSLTDIVAVMARCAVDNMEDENQACCISDLCEMDQFVKDLYAGNHTMDGFLDIGFGGELFACEEEFLECEYKDAEYMKHLLTENEFKAWEDQTDLS